MVHVGRWYRVKIPRVNSICVWNEVGICLQGIVDDSERVLLVFPKHDLLKTNIMFYNNTFIGCKNCWYVDADVLEEVK